LQVSVSSHTQLFALAHNISISGDASETVIDTELY
jgi:hypothetical protein